MLSDFIFGNFYAAAVIITEKNVKKELLLILFNGLYVEYCKEEKNKYGGNI